MRTFIKKWAGRLGRWLRWLVVRLAVIWGIGVILLALTIYFYGRIDHAQEADVIVVLGAGVQRNNRPGPSLIRRSEQAAALWQKGLASHIICSGGTPGEARRSEADACREILVEEGVTAEAILLEDRSRSTEENAFYTRQTMDENGWKTAIVVSDGYHLLRASWLFNQVGLTIYTSPAASPSFGNWLTAMGRELGAFHWQAFKDVLGLPFTYVPVL
jgi:uncharacterized SAM-binding protein YcdF (DUF218 family)